MSRYLRKKKGAIIGNATKYPIIILNDDVLILICEYLYSEDCKSLLRHLVKPPCLKLQGLRCQVALNASFEKYHGTLIDYCLDPLMIVWVINCDFGKMIKSTKYSGIRLDSTT